MLKLSIQLLVTQSQENIRTRREPLSVSAVQLVTIATRFQQLVVNLARQVDHTTAQDQVLAEILPAQMANTPTKIELAPQQTVSSVPKATTAPRCLPLISKRFCNALLDITVVRVSWITLLMNVLKASTALREPTFQSLV